MRDRTEFLSEVLPRIHAAEAALHDGDVGPRVEMWSQTEPVTLMGAAMNATGWDEVRKVFDVLAARFSNCESCEWEVVAAEVGQDLAYIVAIERTTASVAGGPPTPYALRSTTILRREHDEWRIVHRHGDAYDDRAGPLMERLVEPDTGMR
jgi:ketosteroid isomerase-like protein